MRFIPAYCVSYKGLFYEAGEVVEIDEKDADMMLRHGTIDPAPQPASKRGRARRADNGQSGTDAPADKGAG
nr:MAG TPA: hypothetical protein [Caudoviricetes sp.]